MSTHRPMSYAKRASACVALLAISLLAATVAAPNASAGLYSVRQCDYQLGIGDHDFNWQASGSPTFNQYVGSNCGEFGLALRNPVGPVWHYPNGGYAGYFAYAPTGTSIYSFKGFFGTTGRGINGVATYGLAVSPSNARSYFFQGNLPPGSFDRPVGREWHSSQAGFTAKQVQYQMRCGQPDWADFTGPCGQKEFDDLRLRGRSFEFQLNDQDVPGVSVGGTLLAGGWINGTRSLDYWGQDSGGGLTGVTATVDDGTSMSSPSSCSVVGSSYTRLQPCPLVRSGSFSLNTAQLPDGRRAVTVRTTDVGGASAQQARTVNVDNTAPSPPTDISVDGGEDWRSTNDFTVRWSNPTGQHAPLTRTHYELCPVSVAGSCTPGTRDGAGDGTMTIGLPARGAYRLRAWIEDAAGNVNSAAKSAPVMLRYDDQAPGTASPDVSTRWLNAQEAVAVYQQIRLGAGEVMPVSQIKGYSVTTTGSDPDASIEATGDPATHRLNDLPEGLTTLKARAVSGSGVASTSVGSATLKMDKSAPAVVASGLPDPVVWSREPVEVQIDGVDQPTLSGMSPAPPGDSIKQGAFVSYRLDGELPQLTAGAMGRVVVSSDGRHSIAYQASDSAGNRSSERSATFKIDRTPPQASWDYMDPNDPRQLTVTVTDPTSGVSTGHIDYRPTGDLAYRRMPTTLQNGQLVARVDDLSLPDGRYEFRAVVHDVAGNVASTERRADGSTMSLTLPLRVRSHVRVGSASSVRPSPCARKASRKASAVKRRVARSKCKRLKVIVRAGRTTLRPKFGKRVASVGQVSTAAGIPVSNAYVALEGQMTSGGPFVPLGAARADRNGVFRFVIPSGPSRTVRYRYEGTSLIRPAYADIQTSVPAALTFQVNRGFALNGQSVMFSGRVRGRPIPAGGKLVVLEAKVPGVAQWRTFGTVRTNGLGQWRYRREFTSTLGMVRYQFRAIAPSERTYPYRAARSKTVNVTVWGPTR